MDDLLTVVCACLQRSMLAQIASRLRTRQAGGQGGQGGGGGAGIVVGEDGEAVLMDDNCSVSVDSLHLLSLSFANGSLGHVATCCQ